MRKLRKDSGIGLLVEMLCVCMIMACLACLAVPNVVQIQKSQEQNSAKARVQQFSIIQLQLALCAAQTGCTPPVGLSAAVSAYTSGVPLVQGAYQYTWTNLGGGLWSYVAVPGQSIFAGTQVFFVDQSSVVRCGNNVGAPAC